MSKKDYQLVAHVLLNTWLPESMLDNLIEDFVDTFQSENPRFDANKFRNACWGAL